MGLSSPDRVFSLHYNGNLSRKEKGKKTIVESPVTKKLNTGKKNGFWLEKK